MPVWLLTPLAKWIGGGILIALVAGGAYAYVTTAAYNRGVSATVKRMQVLIDKGTEKVTKDLNHIKTVPEDQLDEELRKLCEAHKKPEQKCGP